MKNRSRVLYRMASLLMLILIFAPKITLAQGSGVIASVSIDTSQKVAVIVMSIKSNTRRDITAIRITMASGKFSAYLAEKGISVLPLSDLSKKPLFVSRKHWLLVLEPRQVATMHFPIDSRNGVFPILQFRTP